MTHLERKMEVLLYEDMYEQLICKIEQVITIQIVSDYSICVLAWLCHVGRVQLVERLQIWSPVS